MSAERQGHLIEIANAGPIRELAIEMPEPGVYELRGDHGEGKTTALKAIARASGENVDVPLRDGAAKGYVKLDGTSIFSIGKVNRTTGKAEVHLLSVSPLADFIEPGVKDHAAAERIRIQAILRLIDLDVTEHSIATLVDGDEEALKYLDQQEGIDLLIQKDIVAAADKVRRLIHQLKTSYLRDVDLAAATITANTVDRPAQLVDMTLAEAEAAHVTVIRTLERLSGEASQRQSREQERADIHATLGERPDVSAAELHLQQRESISKGRAEQVLQIEAEIQQMKVRLAEAQGTAEAAFSSYQEAKKDLDTIRSAAVKWDQRKAILEQPITGATEADVQKAAAAVTDAKSKLEAARASDEYRKKLAARDLAETRKEESEKLAKHFEQIALNVTGKLGTLLAEAGLFNLTVEDDQLVVIGKDGVSEPVHRLSYAEKLQLVVTPYLARNPDAVLAFPWEQWTCLKPGKQKELAEDVAAAGLYMVTEVPDEGAIRVRKVS